MKKEIWQEQLEARLAKTKARYANSIVRNSYTDNVYISHIQNKIKLGIETLEGYLTDEYIETLIGVGRAIPSPIILDLDWLAYCE